MDRRQLLEMIAVFYYLDCGEIAWVNEYVQTQQIIYMHIYSTYKFNSSWRKEKISISRF